MQTDMTLSGGCLCGSITFSIDPPFLSFTHCYCQRCRKAGGSGRASALVTLADQLKWTAGSRQVNRWDMPAAASFATSFCPQCGCHLPRLTRDQKYAVIPAGSLDNNLAQLPECHEHWESRADWVCLDERSLPVYDGDAP